jgi:CubicO group peptidase (beta-lactamase class C family)
MKSILFPVVLVLLLSSCTNKESQTKPVSNLESQVDSLIKTYIDSSKIAGIAIGVFKGDERILLKSYGFADLEFEVKLPVNASFEIGSITKQFTAAAILQLAENRRINLEDEITKYINFNTQGKRVTIRHLLSHTSGIKGFTELPEFGTLSMQKYSRDTLLRIVETKSYDFDPGEELIYNNTGFFILGLIIEKISGKTYEEYVKENLFEKAGMTNSYYGSESKVIKNRAHGYDTGEKGLIHAAYLNHTWPYAAGSLCSTVEDLVKWNNALHHGKILSDSMYHEFVTPIRLNDGTNTHYAKGITVRDQNGRRMLEHAGGINGFLSENRYFPNDNISIIVLINSTGSVSPVKVAAFITETIFGKPSNEFHVYSGNLSKLTGIYKGHGIGKDMIVNVTKNDSVILIGIDNSKPKYLKYINENLWVDESSSSYKFLGSEGSINKLQIDEVYGFYILKKIKSE